MGTCNCDTASYSVLSFFPALGNGRCTSAKVGGFSLVAIAAAAATWVVATGPLRHVLVA